MGSGISGGSELKRAPSKQADLKRLPSVVEVSFKDESDEETFVEIGDAEAGLPSMNNETREKLQMRSAEDEDDENDQLMAALQVVQAHLCALAMHCMCSDSVDF